MKHIEKVVLVGGKSLQVGIDLSEVIGARLQVRDTQPDCILLRIAEAKLLHLFRPDAGGSSGQQGAGATRTSG